MNYQETLTELISNLEDVLEIAKKKLVQKKPYPTWVCQPCGLAASKGRSFALSTYHRDRCDVCEVQTDVTEPRDFYYPQFKGHK